MIKAEKIKKNFSTLVAVFLFSVTTWAASPEILVVSDIDDTLKISHVLSSWDSFMNAGRYKNHFRGMSEILVKLEKDQGTHAKFAYVSNAPKSLMEGSHRKFIALNGFPLGALYVRDKLDENQHKLVTIQKLIDENKPEYVVLIGDNGENDPKFYEAIVKKNPKIQFLTLIHRVYTSKKGAKDQGSPIFPGQLSYVTSVEVAEEFFYTKLISENSFNSFVKAIVPEILIEKMTESTGTLAFPKWMNCADHLALFDPWLVPADVTALLEKYYAVRAKRCK